MSKVLVVIPAYNEEESLPGVLTEIRKVLEAEGHGYRFIVVNDGSTDRTREIAEAFARSMPLEIINHPSNLNVGAVFRNGLTRAAELAEPQDLVLTTEGDNTHVRGCHGGIWGRDHLQIRRSKRIKEPRIGGSADRRRRPEPPAIFVFQSHGAIEQPGVRFPGVCGRAKTRPDQAAPALG